MALTEEQIKEALKSTAIQEAIDAAVEKATKGLKAKNDELLGEKKDLKGKLEELETQIEDIRTKDATKNGDVEKVKTTLEAKHKKELDALNEKLTKLNGQLETHVIGEGLTAALVKNKILSTHMDAVKALIKTNFKGEVGDNDGKPFAKFDGKAVDEFVAGWVQTEQGKHFVSADDNSGGGSNGANGQGRAATDNNGKKTMTRKAFDAMSPADKMKVSKEGVSLTD